jgi:glycosyltransferase involved in cell wall biosynthesis
MVKILMLYKNDLFYDDSDTKALAGTQTAFIELSKAFLGIGCMVDVLTSTINEHYENNYYWGNLNSNKIKSAYDLIIVNVSPHLFFDFRKIKAKKKVLWIHNEAKYLLYWNRLKYIIRFLPIIVFSGRYHSATLPFFIPSSGRKIIYYGLSKSVFDCEKEKEIPIEKKVFFTSNPLRSLRWLVDIWVNHIYPVFPDATLHVFSNWKTYGAWGNSVQERMKKELDYANSFKSSNVILRDVLPKHELFKELKTGRAMFYKGDKAETFCLAVAEAQALGLPAVVCDLGSMKERVEHDRTGFVVNDDKKFIECAIRILQEDNLFDKFSINSINKYMNLNWERAAYKFLEV